MATHYYTQFDRALTPFIKLFWLYEGDVPAYRRERRLPDGRASLIFNLHMDRIRVYHPDKEEQYTEYSGSVVNGPRSIASILDATGLTLIVGVEFCPGGARALLGLPLSEIHNQTVALELVWGQEATHLRERLCIATTPQDIFLQLERFLLTRYSMAQTLHPVLSRALDALDKASDKQTITDLANNIGISHTHLITLFRDATGLTPKQFQRVQRFQNIVQSLDPSKPQAWAEQALNYGYFDQAHFIHDFQAFAGMTPATYLAQRSGHYNHIVLP